jgi:tetratricopeptide (TPR) repeat protein
MKSVLFSAIILLLNFSAFSQQSPKAEDALILEYYQNQLFAEAADYLKKTYPEPVTDTKVLARLAYTSQMASKLADAEGYYQRIYDTDSTNTTVLFNLGAINIRRGNSLKAGGYYKKIIQKDTNNFMVYKQLATISSDEGDQAAGLIYLKKANQLNPAEPDVASDLSNAYVNLKQFSLAETILDEAITLDPENSVLLLSQLRLVYTQNMWEETKKTAIKLVDLGNHSGFVLTKLQVAYYSLKDYVCAIETMAEISKQELTETNFYIAALSYKELKDQPNAIEYLKKAINAGISPNIADYYSEMADSYETLNKYKNAIMAYQKGLQFDEKPLTWYLLATLYDLQLKNKKMALTYYRKYIAAKPLAKEGRYKAYAQSRILALAH